MRYILIILVFLSVGANAQMVIKAHANYRPYAQPAANLLLDDYPGAAAAYSLRKLDKDYTGAAIRVRKDTTGQPESDIGFTASGELDTVALKDFAKTRNCFVTVWYDQSGNGRNASRTTQSEQARVALNGVIERQKGKVSIFFDGSNDHYTLSDFALPTSSIFSAANNTVSTSSNVHSIYCRGTSTVLNAQRDGLLYIWRTNNNIEFQRSNGTSFPTATRATTIGNFNLYGGIYTGTQLIAYNNGIAGTSVNTTVSGVSSNPVTSIGATYEASFTRYYFGGFISEIIIYASDQSSNRTGIENNINDYYNIYWNGDFTGILDTYPNSAAAYSLRNLSSTYKGPLIRVRKDTTGQPEIDVYGDYYGNLDTVGLKNFLLTRSGFVTTWYDQSGNSRNTIQSTQANQPRIVNVGVIDRVNSKPAVLFDGTNDALDAPASGSYFAFLHSPGQSSVYIVTQPSLLSGQKVMLSTTRLSQERGVQLNFSDTSAQHLIGTSTNLAVNNTSAGGYASINTQYLLSFYGNPDNATASLRSTIEKNNGNAVNNNTGTIPPSTGFSGRDFRLGDRAAGGQAFNGYLQEIVIYNSGQSSNKLGISGNINIYYAIY